VIRAAQEADRVHPEPPVEAKLGGKPLRDARAAPNEDQAEKPLGLTIVMSAVTK
jgi:hypothetical protein